MAADLLMVKVVINNLEVSHNETEAKDPNTINVNFSYKGEHDINNIMEKMSINPHQQQQQGNLYQ